MTTLQTALLFAGGYLVSRLLLRANVHEQFVAWLVRRAGGRVSRIVLGLMAGACVLSMVAPNALVVLAMIPVVTRLRDAAGAAAPTSYATLLTMGLVYGANIGGTGSLLGSPANLYLLINLRLHAVAGHESVHFVSWLAFGLPLAALLLLVCWLVVRLLAREAMSAKVESDLRCERHALYNAAARFGLGYVVAWGAFIGATMVAKVGAKPLWALTISGKALVVSWADAVALAGTVVLAAALFWPRRSPEPVSPSSSRTPLLAMRDLWLGVPLKGVLLGVVVLVVLVLIAKSGLVPWLTKHLPGLMPAGFGALSTALLLALVTIYGTEVLSNTTVATVVFPLALALGQRVGANPVAMMVGVSLASTCAFMTPLATPVNALAIAGVGQVSLGTFLRVGALANAVCGVIVALWMLGPLPWVLG